MAKIKEQMKDLVEEQIASIDEQLQEIEKKMRPYEQLNETKIKLMAARRALMGTGSRTTGNAGNRLTVDDVVAYLKANPGAAPGQIAQNFGVAQSTVSSHLYRHKERFIVKDGRYWVRDPENGIDTADDVGDDDE